MSEWRPWTMVIGVDMASPDEQVRAAKIARIAEINEMLARGEMALPRRQYGDHELARPLAPKARHLRLVP
jgi:hypothetical protein